MRFFKKKLLSSLKELVERNSKLFFGFPDLGKFNENKFEEAVKILQKRNPLICGYHRTARGDSLDCKGIDFLIFLAKPLFLSVPILFLSVPIQIKSGVGAIKEHYEKYPHLIALRMLPTDTPEIISVKLEKLIINLLKRAPALLEELEKQRNIK